MKSFNIIGAGPVGCALALKLEKLGNKVDIFEKRDIEQLTSNSLPPIPLLLSPRSHKIIKEVGLWEDFLIHAKPLTGRLRHLPDKNTIFMPYGKRHWINYAIDRNNLSKIFLKKVINNKNITFYSGHRLIDIMNPNIIFETQHGNISYQRKDYIVGADGAASMLRKLMMKFDPEVNYYEKKFSHVYTNLKLSVKGLDKNVLHSISIFPQINHMLVCMPEQNELLSCTLVIPRDNAKGKNQVKELLSKSYPHLYPSLEKLNNLDTLKFLDLYRIELDKYYSSKQNIFLLGDSAHTILPFMGQGVNLGLDDVYHTVEFLKNDFTDQGLHDFFSFRNKEGQAAACISENHYHDIVNSSKQKYPGFLNRTLKTIISRIFLQTPLPVVQLDFMGKPYSSLIDKDQFTFKPN